MRVRPCRTRRSGTNRYHLRRCRPFIGPSTLCGILSRSLTDNVSGDAMRLCPKCSREYMRGCAEGWIEYEPVPFKILGKVAS